MSDITEQFLQLQNQLDDAEKTKSILDANIRYKDTLTSLKRELDTYEKLWL